MNKSIVFIIFFFVVLFSCTKKEEDPWLNKKIIFPKELVELKNSEINPLNNFINEINGKLKVVSIIDATCVKCIVNQLNKIDSLFSTIIKENNKQKIIFILNVNKGDSVNFIKNMYPYIKAKGILIWDNSYHFETKNNIFTEKVSRRTFLLDENNKIIQVGNPLFEPRLYDAYKELLKGR